MSTLYASFSTPADAEKAAGAMLDHGAVADDISLLSNEKSRTGQPIPKTEEVVKAEESAKGGISTTTPADVAAGTVKGATIGLSVGTLAALASLFIPGVGLVLGGGAFAAALMGGAGTMIAGAAAGGIAGFLADQGVPKDVITRYSSAFEEGGAILAIAIPSGALEPEEAEALMVKYGASNIATVNASRPLMEGTEMPPPEPLIVQGDNPDIAPVMYAPTVAPVVIEPTVAAVPVVPGVRTLEETITTPAAEPLVDVIDPVTGTVVRRPVETVVPNGENAQLTTLVPNDDLVTDPATGHMHQTVGRSVTISEEPVVVTDPATGLKRPAKLVEEQHAVVRDPAAVDAEGHVSMMADGPEETVIVREKHLEL